MDERHIECPVCGVMKRRPTPHIPSTSWVDSCACNDMGSCMEHRFNPDDAPNRPDNNTMLARAQLRANEQLREFNKHKEMFFAIEDTKHRLLESEALLSEAMDVINFVLLNPNVKIKDKVKDLLIRYETYVNGSHDGEVNA